MSTDHGSSPASGPGAVPSDDLGGRVFFVGVALLVYWLGTLIPIPGINTAAYAWLFHQSGSGPLQFVNTLMGGAIGRMSIFSLSVTPYVSASIVMVLVTAAFPSLKALEKSGPQGRKQVNQYARYLTILLAAFMAQGIALGLEDARVVIAPGWFFRSVTIVTLVAGAVLVMWLGEQISKHGVGNGVFVILVAGPVLHFLVALAASLGN